MDINIFISILGGLINMLLSIILPAILKKNNNDLMTNIKKNYTNNKSFIITSSLIVILTIYITLLIVPIDNLLPISNNNNNNIEFFNLSKLCNEYKNENNFDDRKELFLTELNKDKIFISETDNNIPLPLQFSILNRY
jgi:hypothetical protein